MSKILVAYASKHQSTAEIATFIGGILSDSHLNVEVRDIEDIHSLVEYTAVVIGSAVYMGHWLQSATQFLNDFQEQLASLPVWIFSTGPTGEGDPATLLDGFLMPENIREAVNVINPHHIMLFHGSLDNKRLGIGERMMVKAVNAPMGDYRDWNIIRAWSNRIAAELKGNEILNAS